MANPIAAKLAPMDILKDRLDVKRLAAVVVRFYRHFIAIKNWALCT